jgi:hypothetical protein
MRDEQDLPEIIAELSERVRDDAAFRAGLESTPEETLRASGFTDETFERAHSRLSGEADVEGYGIKRISSLAVALAAVILACGGVAHATTSQEFRNLASNDDITANWYQAAAYELMRTNPQNVAAINYDLAEAAYYRRMANANRAEADQSDE